MPRSAREQLRPQRRRSRRSVRKPAVSSASCSSSASRGSGRSSSRTRAIASASRAPRSPADDGSLARRDCTAWLRRSSSGASSRNAYGLALRISCANSDGSGVSRATSRSSPRWMRLEHARAARRSPSPLRGNRGPSGRRAGDRESGDRRGCSPGTRPRRGRPPPSGRRRASAGSAAPPCALPRARGTASEMVVFHRHRVLNTGASRNAWTSTSRVVSGCR